MKKRNIFLPILTALALSGCGTNFIGVTNITLSETEIMISEGETKQIFATVTPEDATDKTVTWSVTSGNEYATVDANGKITGVKEGEAVVVAKSSNNITKACNVTVLKTGNLPESITMDETAALVVGNTKQLEPVIFPEDAAIKTLTWSVSSGDAVTVSNTGLVTAVKEGSASVTAKTVNNLTATCVFTVVNSVINPTKVTLDEHEISLFPNGTKTLTASILPSEATERSLTWSVVEGEDVVSVNNGVVKALKVGHAKVQVTTSNNLSDVCEVTVAERTLKAFVNKDEHSLIDGNFYQQVNGGEFVEITDKETIGGVPVYNVQFGATIKVYLKTVGYFEPTGLNVNNVFHEMVDNYVTFEAVVEDPDDEMTNFFDVEVVYNNNTPLIGDYVISFENTSHISLTFTYEINGQETMGCSQGDVIIIHAKSNNEDFGVKTIKGYSFKTNDMPRKEYFDIKKIDDETYSFVTPYSADEYKTIYILLEEIDISAFKDSGLVGEYATLRTYSLSGSDSYIKKFDETMAFGFNAGGEMTYSADIAYASKAENGVITGMCGTSSIEAYYGENIIVLGKTSNGTSLSTPLSGGSTDIIVAVKTPENVSREAFISETTMDNAVIAIGSNKYAIFSFYYNDTLYASCFINEATKTIVCDTTVVKYQGETLLSEKPVYQVFDKNGNSLLHVGYDNDGTQKDLVLITERENGYTNGKNTFVFINNDKAVFDDNTYEVTGETSLVLKNPTHEVDIELDVVNKTFEVTDEKDIETKSLEIANLKFTGMTNKDWDDYIFPLTIEFGPSNTDITGYVLQDNGYAKYYWEFEGTFDSTQNIINITITNAYMNKSTSFDNSAIGKTKRLKVEDGKLTILDNIGTQSNVFNTKGCVVTCSDFHF